MPRVLLVLPLACYALITASLWRRSAKADPRPALLRAAVAWGLLLASISELLSLFTALTVEWLALGWLVATLGSAVLALKTPSAKRRLILPVWRPPTLRLSALPDLALLVPICVIVTLTAVTALASWPSSWDGMTYHLARAAHWAQDRSLAHYPTGIIRQLYNPPWAELAMLHVQLLSGQERAVNFVQWLSMLGSVVGVSLVARQLGAGPRGQLIAAAFAATLPMGILQAASTQNSYSPALWVVCGASALLTLRKHPHSMLRMLYAGAALGLALLTKNTVAVFALPLPMMLMLPPRLLSPALIKQAAVIGSVVLLLNAPYMARNSALFGSPIAPDRQRGDEAEFALGVVNTSFSLPMLISNVSRNVALHLDFPPRVGRDRAFQALLALHQALGLDPEDPRTSFLIGRDFSLPTSRVSELATGNPLHFALIVLLSLAALAIPRLRRSLLVRYGAALLLGALLFCLVFKWQLLHSRLHLPLFVLWAPLVGLALERRAVIALAAVATLSVWAWTPLVENQSRPLIGEDNVFETDRFEQQFRNRRGVRDAYEDAAAFVQQVGCQQFGLRIGTDSYEYPLWAMLEDWRAAGGRIEHLPATPAMRRLAQRWPPFDPCVIIVTGPRTLQQPGIDTSVYRLVFSRDDGNKQVDLYAKPELVPERRR